MGAATGTNIAEIDLGSSGGTGNTLSAIAKYDNYIAVAKQSSNLLGVNIIVQNSFSVAPNPMIDVVNISKNSNIEITTASITDINGRIVKEVNNDISSINVADLNAGVYFLKLNTSEGSGTTKLIKN